MQKKLLLHGVKGFLIALRNIEYNNLHKETVYNRQLNDEINPKQKETVLYIWLLNSSIKESKRWLNKGATYLN